MSFLFHGHDWMIFRTEVRGYFSHVRALHMIPLLFLGAILMAWVYPPGSPYAPVIIISLVGLEPQFNNIFFRTRNELEAMTVHPVDWPRTILMKNLAAVTLLVVLLLACSLALLYFSPDKVTGKGLFTALAYTMSVIFPILCMGNAESLHRPRRVTGFRFDDMISATWMLIVVMLSSIPFYIFFNLLGSPLLCAVYVVAAAAFWYRKSIPKTAEEIRDRSAEICENL